MIGTTLDHYRLEEYINRGGSATVYKGTDLRSGTSVAVKVLHPEYAGNATFLAFFRNEAETNRRLPRHVSIARTLDFRAGTQPYLVMELLDGEDLSARLSATTRLPLGEAVGIACQVADALRFAHRHDVIHRDIKPENIRLTASRQVKVMDFGIARARRAAGASAGGPIIGTPEYIAPEIWSGQDGDARMDVYALGIVLYEMLSGEVPYNGRDTEEIKRAHLRGQARPLRDLRPDVPPALEAIVDRAMARAPGERLASAAKLLEALTTQPRTTPRPGDRAGTPRPEQRVITAVSAPSQGRVRVGYVPPQRQAAPRGRRQELGFLLRRDRRIPLRGAVVQIGRDPRCEICFGDSYVSRQHARIQRQPGGYLITDSGSRHGTFVNNRSIRGSVALRHGDRIRFGREELAFLLVQTGSGPADGPSQGGAVGGQAAAICHLGAFFTAAAPSVPLVALLLALLLALFGWRQPGVAPQARQALIYQLILIGLLVLVQGSVVWLIWLVGTLYAGYAAIRCSRGERFSYPVLGDLAGVGRWGQRGSAHD